MTEHRKYKCLRCTHEFSAPFNPDEEPQERTCPKCRSNSVRHLKQRKSKEDIKASGGGEK